MNLFNKLVDEALKNRPELTALRVVVEKELLHHDILRILSENDFLRELTFIGGTVLRSCYGGVRLSEDLDFTGGVNFSRKSLSLMGHSIIENLNKKYGLHVTVSEPSKETKNVDTWKIKIETRKEQKHMPAQRINIDICAVSSYDRKPMMLINPYGVDMGTNGLVIQSQSREEIYSDKLLSFALRPNRIKYRDLWDMVWLHQQGISPSIDLIPYKLEERNLTKKHFLDLFHERVNIISSDNRAELEFKKEMQRFLPMSQIKKVIEQDSFWSFLAYMMKDLEAKINN